MLLNRHKFTFRNGNYYTKTDQKCGPVFVPNDQDSSAPANRFDTDFPYEHLSRYNQKNWRYVPTPLLDCILDYQQFSSEEKDFFFTMLGRLFFARGDMENWNIGFILAGVACTGKSVILRDIVCRFFQEQNIVYLEEDVSMRFTEQLLTKSQPLITVASEISGSDNSSLLPNLQAIITGTPHSYDVRQFGNISYVNPNHFIGVCNGDVGQYLDSNLAVFRFRYSVAASDIDLDLGSRIVFELPNIMHKAVCAYSAYVDHYWSLTHLPVNPVPKSLLLNSSSVIPVVVDSEPGYLKSAWNYLMSFW
jgi:hypothetical protein